MAGPDATIAISDRTPLSGSDLCRSCGVCCDGTLFGRVRLQPEDPAEPLRIAGITIRNDDDTGRHFQLGCAAHNGCCQVYASRPANCRSYECKLLRRFAKGAVTWAEAAAQIARVRRLREQLGTEAERLQRGMGRASVVEISGLVPSAADLAGDVELRKRWAPVLLRLVALRRLARESFHAPRKPEDPQAAPDESAVR